MIQAEPLKKKAGAGERGGEGGGGSMMGAGRLIEVLRLKPCNLRGC